METVIDDAGPVGLDLERLARIGPWMESWVGSGRLAGMTVAVHRRGRTAYLASSGMADLARGVPMTAETVVRIYSMTKPLTSVAFMMLYEEGRFQLDDPIGAVLPCFAEMRVWTPGGEVPAERGITYRDLLTHTSGLTYGFIEGSVVAGQYRAAGVDFGGGSGSLEEMAERLAGLPLMAQPGAAWNYSVATDVVGHLVAVHSGVPFHEFLTDRVLRPLGMVDTGFHVPDALVPRFAANYVRGADGRASLADDPLTSGYRGAVGTGERIASGGGGLLSTVGDYLRFCRFLLGGGVLDGVRLLGRKTVALMMSNHLGGDMASMGAARFSEASYAGIGFGLGFSVMLDPARAQIVGSAGECAWGGVASTAFWVDPAEDMAVVLLTQLMPSSTYPIRRELRVLTYAAVVD